MNDLNFYLAVAAGSVLVLTLVSGSIKKRLWTSEALICLCIGIAVGPQGFGLFELDVLANEKHLTLVEQVTRLTLALSVMSAALSLPRGFVSSNWRALAIVLGPGTLLMWFASAGIAWMSLELSALMAILIGAILTPTDPVLARSIVSGSLAKENVPSSTRNMITAESGINDGLALPIVLFPLLLMDAGGEVLRRSLGYLAWELLGALLVGWILGQVTGRVFRLMHRKGVAEAKSLTAATTALALFALATVGLLGADGILSVFIAGIILNKQMKEEHAEAHEHFQDAVDRSFTLPVFILLGIIAPFELWISQGWPILVASLAIVAFRRIPAWIVLQAIGKPYRNRHEGSFAGWFGPIGVAALFYAAVALQHGAPQDVWASVTLVIVLSTFVHGISGTPLTRRHGASSSCQTGAGPSATGRSNRT